MSHKYSSFGTAFADNYAKFPAIKGWLDGCLLYIYDIFNYADAGNWQFALYGCGNACYNLYLAFQYLIDYDAPTYDQSYYYESWYWASQGGAITMDDILTTMLGANPNQVTNFVGLVDAYRQSIWNQPFNAEYYAALARGFMVWQ